MITVEQNQNNSHLNGHTADANARQYIEALLAGTRPERPYVGRYAVPIGYMDDAFTKNPSSVARVFHSLIECNQYPGLAELFNGSPAPEQGVGPGQQNENARQYVEALLAGQKPDIKPDVGHWQQRGIEYLEEEFDRNPGNVENVLRALIKSDKYSDLKKLLQPVTPMQGGATVEQSLNEDSIPALPQHIQNYIDQNDTRSLVLDAMIEFFRYWCTRSYEGDYEAAAIWVLATVAARRVHLDWRTGVWTPLYIIIVSESTTHAKTEVSTIAKKIINECGLGFLLTSDEHTPQKMLQNMAGQHVSRNYSIKNKDDKEFTRLQKAFSGQQGWIYDEFGNKLETTMKSTNHDALLYTLLKKLYDCQETFKYETITRGEDLIELPYLTLIGTATPACLKPIAGNKSRIWTDGTAARLSFIVPPRDELRLQSAPNETTIVPVEIIHALQKWHVRLGIPDCEIIDTAEEEALLEQAHGEDKSNKKKKESNRPAFEVHKGNLPQTDIYMTREVYRAQDEYYKALATLAYDHKLDERFKSTYGRLPEKALRIAMLLASLENCSHIDMRHFARGMHITEHWRRDFHELIAQVSSEPQAHALGDVEQQVMNYLVKLPAGTMITSWQLGQKTTALRKVGSKAIRDALEELYAANVGVVKDGTGKSAQYGLQTNTET